jgi:hypothetical integral membrane protein (TIGR02206 family)
MQEFSPYGPSHLIVMALLAAGGLALVVWGRGHRDPTTVARDCRWLAVAILIFMLPLQAVAIVRSGYDLQRSLPLQLCDVAALLAPYALWTRRHWAVSLTYYWGLTLTTQAVITPDLSRDFPDPVFILFWGMHLLIVWAAIYLTWGLGIAPDWRSYGTAVVVTLGWMVSVFGVNALIGSNYGYLNAKPAAASLLDYFGPWPTYLLVEIVIVSTVWLLMTLPWTQRSRARPQRERATYAAR